MRVQQRLLAALTLAPSFSPYAPRQIALWECVIRTIRSGRLWLNLPASRAAKIAKNVR
jgi:hypothetical protein